MGAGRGKQRRAAAKTSPLTLTKNCPTFPSDLEQLLKPLILIKNGDEEDRLEEYRLGLFLRRDKQSRPQTLRLMSTRGFSDGEREPKVEIDFGVKTLKGDATPVYAKVNEIVTQMFREDWIYDSTGLELGEISEVLNGLLKTVLRVDEGELAVLSF
jgi:hypothetical protein